MSFPSFVTIVITFPDVYLAVVGFVPVPIASQFDGSEYDYHYLVIKLIAKISTERWMYN